MHLTSISHTCRKFAGTQDSDDLLVSAKVDSVNTYDQVN